MASVRFVSLCVLAFSAATLHGYDYGEETTDERFFDLDLRIGVSTQPGIGPTDDSAKSRVMQSATMPNGESGIVETAEAVIRRGYSFELPLFLTHRLGSGFHVVVGPALIYSSNVVDWTLTGHSNSANAFSQTWQEENSSIGGRLYFGAGMDLDYVLTVQILPFIGRSLAVIQSNGQSKLEYQNTTSTPYLPGGDGMRTESGIFAGGLWRDAESGFTVSARFGYMWSKGNLSVERGLDEDLQAHGATGTLEFGWLFR